MFRILIINVALFFSMSLHADITSIFTNTEKETTTETTTDKSTGAGTVFGKSPGKITTTSEESEKSEAASVFGKDKTKNTEESSKGSGASSVFGTHKGASEKAQNEETQDNKNGYSKERISDDANPRTAPNYMWPVDGGKIVSFYGWRSSRRFHDGIDIKADSGINVFAAKSGEVIYSGRRIRGYGNMVVIRHNAGFSTVYAHNKVNLVNVGDIVQQGDVIAHVGSTGHSSGPHLHFEVRKGKYSADPLKYLSARDIKKHSGAYENSPDNPF